MLAFGSLACFRLACSLVYLLGVTELSLLSKLRFVHDRSNLNGWLIDSLFLCLVRTILEPAVYYLGQSCVSRISLAPVNCQRLIWTGSLMIVISRVFPSRPPLPTMLTRKLASTIANVEFATNPCRYDPTHTPSPVWKLLDRWHACSLCTCQVWPHHDLCPGSAMGPRPSPFFAKMWFKKCDAMHLPILTRRWMRPISVAL